VARLDAARRPELTSLLQSLRALDGLSEPSPGRFTRGHAAFLHFHASATGVVADLKAGDHWRRYSVDDPAGRRTLVRDARRVLAGRRTDLGGRPA